MRQKARENRNGVMNTAEASPGNSLNAQEIEQSQAYLNALIESTSDLIWSVDPHKFGLLTFNSSLRSYLEESYGLQAEIGMTPSDIFPNEHAAYWLEIYKKVLQDRHLRLEHKLPWTERYLNMSLDAITRDGEVIGISVFGRDVTERKQTEEALRESEEKFKIVAMNTPDHIIIQDCDLRYVWVLNPQLGLTVEGMVGRTDYDILEPEDAKELTKLKRGVLESGEPIKVKVPLVSLDGKTQYFDGSYIPKRDSSGAVDGIIGYFRNVTESVRAENALRESEEMLLQSQQMAHVGHYALDTASGTWTSSAVLDEVFGIGPAYERTVEGWLGLVHPENRDEMLVYVMDHVISGGNPFDKEYRIIRDGDCALRWVHGVGRIDIDDTGHVTRLFGTIQDITEQKLAKEALQESEALYEDLVETSQDLIFQCDAAGRFTYLNPAWEQVLGYKLDELLGRRFTDFQDPEIATRGQKEHARLMQGNVAKNFETTHISKSGQDVRLVFNAKSLTDDDGNIVGTRGSAYDITERKRVEDALERRLVALTQPLSGVENIDFEDLFNLADIQELQDLFAKATGVASIITKPDGIPITKPSNFCRLCANIIRCTKKGLANCMRSDAIIGRYNPEGPIIQQCLSGGLWDAGASISVGGKHIANWLIGQVRNEAQNESKMREYARTIGADEDEVAAAFQEVPAMSEEQFKDISKMLFALAGQLSAMAYQNIQQARFITERDRVEKEKRQFYRETIKSVTQGKLDLVSLDEIKRYLDSAELVESVASTADAGAARHKTLDFCVSKGLGKDRSHLFELGIGEAMTNAIKHAQECHIFAGVSDNSIWVAVSDRGSGISNLTLPGATLRMGFSTKASMGMGYSIMMEASDAIKLCTGAEGTTVILSVDITAPKHDLSLDDYPDTWSAAQNVAR